MKVKRITVSLVPSTILQNIHNCAEINHVSPIQFGSRRKRVAFHPYKLEVVQQKEEISKYWWFTQLLLSAFVRT